MPGAQPTHNIIRKNAEGKWDYIGAGWENDRGGISLVVEPVKGGEKIKGLLVKREPKKPHEASRLEDTLDDNTPLPF